MIETKHTKWEKAGPWNWVRHGKDFYLSFANTGLGPSFWKGDGDGIETALVAPDGTFYILNGDYRKQYDKLFKQGYKACKRFYDQQSAHADSSWSRK